MKFIPSSWQADRIRDRLVRVVGGDWGEEPGTDGLIDVTVIRVADVHGIRIELNEPTIRAVGESSLASRKLRSTSLVLEKSGGGEKQNVGRVALVGEHEGTAICSNFMAVLDCDGKTDASFLNYVFSALYDADMNIPAVKQTTGIQNLDVVAYLTTHIRFPPIDEQLRITAYLDASCRIIDAAAVAKRHQIDVLEKTRSARIHNAVIGWMDQGSPPVGWVKDRIRDRLVRMIGGDWGSDPGLEDGLNDVTVVRVADMDGIQIKLSDPTVRSVSTTSLKSRKLKPDSLVLEKSGGGEKQNVGRVAIVGGHDGEAICSNFMAVLDCDAKTNASFLNYVFSALYEANLNFPAVKQTTGIQNLDTTAYLSLHVAFPGLSEQERIAGELDATMVRFDQVEAMVDSQISTLQSYRKSLIHECVTGQRRITDEDVHRVTAHAASAIA